MVRASDGLAGASDSNGASDLWWYVERSGLCVGLEVVYELLVSGTQSG